MVNSISCCLGRDTEPVGRTKGASAGWDFLSDCLFKLGKWWESCMWSTSVGKSSLERPGSSYTGYTCAGLPGMLSETDRKKSPSVTNVPFHLKKGSLLPCSRNSSLSVWSWRDYGRHCNEENRRPSGWRCQKRREEQSPSCTLWGWLYSYRSWELQRASHSRSCTVTCHWHMLRGRGLILAVQSGLVKGHYRPLGYCSPAPLT